MLSVAGPRCHQGKWMLTGVLLMNETESWKLFIISLQPVFFHIYEILYEALNSKNLHTNEKNRQNENTTLCFLTR